MADSVEFSTVETSDGTIGIVRDNAARQSIANIREGKEAVGAVAWENVKDKPTNVSSFQNDKKYQTEEDVANTLNGTLYAGSSTHGGPAASADKLTTARTISLTGAASGSGSFDGSANSSINVQSLDATKLTGTVPITNLPPSVIERMSVVKDDTERFALTTDSVQNGDVVKVQSTNLMYYVVDDSKLSTEAGYEVFKAGSAASVPWGGVTDKPSSYPPSAHTHTKSQITDFPSSMPNPNNLTMQIEGSDAAVYNGGTAQTFNVTKSALGLDKVNNTADADKSVKYASSAPWIGVTGKPSTFPPSAHTHSMSQITDLGVFGGASATAAGSTGLVPQPAAGDQDKYLSAKGTWESITGKISGTKVTAADTADSIKAYTTRPASANNVFGDGKLRYFLATSSMTEGKPTVGDAAVLDLAWENTSNGGWDTQIAIPAPTDKGPLQIRSMKAGIWQPWKSILDSVNYNEFAPTKTGTGASGTWGINVTGSAGTVNGHTVNSDVPSGAKFTDTTYGAATQSSPGLMLAADKKAVDREFFRMLPKGGTHIPANADLNTIEYIKVGNYYNPLISESMTMKNIPAGSAFIMYVLAPLSGVYDNEETSDWVYRLRIFIDYSGQYIFTQLVDSDTPGNFHYGPWVKMTNSNDLGAVSNTINTHIANKSNPHGVTKAQVGLGNVDNTADADKSVKYASSAGTVNGHTINSDVPAGAVFTDHYSWNEITGKPSTFPPSNHNHDSLYLKLSGGTMAGQLLTSFKSSVATGSYQASATTVPDLLNEVRYSSGCMGSVQLGTAYSGIPAAWYNFLYIPHRSGGVSGAAKEDNCNFGTLLLFGMTTTDQAWVVEFQSGKIVGAFSIRNTDHTYTALKNPNALSITANGKTVKYDGSSAQSISIQSGGLKSVASTLLASGWQGSAAPYTYDLGSTYSNKSVMIGYDGTKYSEDSMAAASDADIVGGEGTVIYAFGDKPTVNIPIVIIYQ